MFLIQDDYNDILHYLVLMFDSILIFLCTDGCMRRYSYLKRLKPWIAYMI